MQKDPAGNAAPEGGFKEGAWYSGSRYLGGKFLPVGQDQPGHTVSTEVAAQTNPANVAYLQSQGAQLAGSNPQQSLDQFQAGAMSTVSGMGDLSGKSDEEIMAGVKQALTPSTPAPTPPNLTATYAGFRASMGATQLEGSLTNINAQIAAIQSQTEARTAAEEAKGGSVPLNVIAGRQTEEQRQSQVQLDSLNLQKGVIVDNLNMVYNNINTLMSLTEQDYTNASQAYQQEFDINSKIYDAFTSQVQARDQMALEVQKAAAANFQTMVNLITSGNIDTSKLSGDQKLQFAQMETKAGLPIGTLSQIQMSPSQRLLNVSNYRGQVTAIMSTPDGQITTQTFGTMQALGTGTLKQEYSQNADDDAANGATLQQLVKSYGGAGGLTNAQILQIYNQNNAPGSRPGAYGYAVETPAQIAAGQFANEKGFTEQTTPINKLGATDQSQIKEIKDAIKNGEVTRDQAAKSFPEYAPYL